MKKNLSRRMFLKATAALAASGALAWVPDELAAEVVEATEPFISDEEWLADPPPFTPYYIKRPFDQSYRNLESLAKLSGLGIGEISVKVYRHRWCCEAILDHYRENGSFPDDF